MKRKVHQIDSRVLKTEQAIKEAFMELVKEKGYNQVTVSDICKKSNINRNTFYLHYLDKDDLVGKMLKTAYSTMDNALKDYTIKYKTSMRRISEVQIRWGIRNLLLFMEPDKELYKTFKDIMKVLNSSAVASAEVTAFSEFYQPALCELIYIWSSVKEIISALESGEGDVNEQEMCCVE